MLRLIYFFLITSTLFFCKPKPAFNHDYFYVGVSKGIIDNPAIDEASGLASSIRNKGMFWTHNDSGDEARIFLIDKNAKHQATIFLDLKNRDWEDIAVGPGPEEGVPYIFIGDIGDNFSRHEYKYIYRLEEPTIGKSFGPIEFNLSDVDSIKFKLPDGSRDTEALMVDPWTRDLYIISKREKNKVNVYVLPYPQSTQEVITAEFVTNIPFRQITAADISTDGNEILVKNYSDVFYWKRDSSETLKEVFKRAPIRLPYATEPQGEAIAFDQEGEGYYTVSEAANKKKPHLMFYRRK